MECSVCGTGDELLYSCGRCGKRLCATHQGRPYHECVPSPDGDWTPPGTRDTMDGEWVALGRRTDEEGSANESADSTDDRRRTQSRSVETPDESVDPPDDDPPEASRPGYGPDRLRPAPVAPADSIHEWFRRQTYLSLTVKVGLIATLCNGLVFSTLVIALSIASA
jgi:hypothetical protein